MATEFDDDSASVASTGVSSSSDSDDDDDTLTPAVAAAPPRRRRPVGQLGGYRPTFASAFKGAHGKVDYVDLQTGAVFRCLNKDEDIFAIQHAQKPPHFKYAITVARDCAKLLNSLRWEALTALLGEAEEHAEQRLPWPLPLTDAVDTLLLSTRTREVVTVSVSGTVLTTPRSYVGWVTITVN